jgi:hypothetical protein
MTADRAENPLECLAPEVQSYVTDHFSLKEDLDHLHQVQRVGAKEAAVFYSARILEVLAAASLKTVELPASENLYANLDALQQFNLIQSTTLSWAHALRRMGNRVRHIQGRLRPEDAELSVLFVERCLEWFFCRFRYRPYRQLQRLASADRPFALTAGGELRVFMQQLDAADFDPRAFAAQVREPGSRAFHRAPALAAVAAEVLLERRYREEAGLILDAALAEFPDDLRLNQLQVLSLSRAGELAKALEWLQRPLWFPFRDDEETVGITAGVHKRCWLADNTQKRWLVESHQGYRHGWVRSRQTNAYLGINAATTALWLGQLPEAQEVAQGVRRLLRKRAAALAKHSADPDLAFSYWDQVSLAEAELLLGEFTAARHRYREAFDAHSEQRANIDVSLQQLAGILQQLGRPESAEAFLAQP